MHRLSDIKMMAGSLLVEPSQAGSGDGASGIIFQTLENRDNSIGKVVVSPVSEKEYLVGTEVVYRRVTAVDIRLYDENEVEQTYKIVNVEDVIAIFEKNDQGGL